MYCPNCGTETATGVKFCRACGMDLQIVAQILSGEIPTAHSTPGLRQKLLRRGFMTMGGGILLAAMFAITGAGLMNIDFGVGEFITTLSGLGGLVLLAGLFMIIYSRFLPNTEYAPPPSQPALRDAQPRISLQTEPFSQSVSSVTEGTTELFDAPERAHRRE